MRIFGRRHTGRLGLGGPKRSPARPKGILIVVISPSGKAWRALAIGLWLLCFFASTILAQAPNDKWQRVYTGEDSIIEIDESSLLFLEDRIMRVIFRTTFSKPESLADEPHTTYKSQLETTEFKLNGLNYRLTEMKLLDASGKIVVTRLASSNDNWRVMKPGGMMMRLFEYIREAAPFGQWKIVGFRSGSEGPLIASPVFAKLREMKVTLGPDRAEVGAKTCSAPVYLSESMTKEDFVRKLEITPEALGIWTDQTAAIVIKCVAAGWRPPQSLLLRLSNGGLLMLWEGIFIELKRA